MQMFIVWFVLIPLEQKANVNHIKSMWNKILEFNQYKKSDKALFNTYADLECLIEKIDEYK